MKTKARSQRKHIRKHLTATDGSEIQVSVHFIYIMVEGEGQILDDTIRLSVTTQGKHFHIPLSFDILPKVGNMFDGNPFGYQPAGLRKMLTSVKKSGKRPYVLRMGAWNRGNFNIHCEVRFDRDGVYAFQTMFLEVDAEINAALYPYDAELLK